MVVFGVWTDLLNRTEISINCHITRGKISKSQQNHFCIQICTQGKFSLDSGKIFEIFFCGSAWCEYSWDRTEIWIDCHIVRG